MKDFNNKRQIALTMAQKYNQITTIHRGRNSKPIFKRNYMSYKQKFNHN